MRMIGRRKTMRRRRNKTTIRKKDLNPQLKPVIPTSFMKSRKKRRIRPLKNIGNFFGTRKNKK